MNCVFEGQVTLADGVQIGANCVLRNAAIGPATSIEPFTLIDDAKVGCDGVPEVGAGEPRGRPVACDTNPSPTYPNSSPPVGSPRGSARSTSSSCASRRAAGTSGMADDR